VDFSKKRKSRARRAKKVRGNICTLRKTRLSVHKTGQHIYAQVVEFDGSKVLAAASTLEKDINKELKNSSNIEAAKLVGSVVAKRAVAAGVKSVAFDRSGFRYHGRVKALADAARENGLEF
jgi:large subunit ribosomal protein L18